MALQEIPVRNGYEKMGAKAYFDGHRKLKAIVSDKGTIKPEESLWEHAKYIWRCSCMTFMTAREHLVWTHWIVSNGFTSSARVLPAGHPVRRVLKVNTFGTAQINIQSTAALHPEYAFLHKLSPFEYSGLSNIFKSSAAAYKF